MMVTRLLVMAPLLLAWSEGSLIRDHETSQTVSITKYPYKEGKPMSPGDPNSYSRLYKYCIQQQP